MDVQKLGMKNWWMLVRDIERCRGLSLAIALIIIIIIIPAAHGAMGCGPKSCKVA